MTISRVNRKGGPRWRAVLVHDGRKIVGRWRSKRWQATEDEAAMQRARELGTIEERFGPNRIPTFAEAAADYLREQERAVRRGDYAPRSLESVRGHVELRLLERFGDLRLDEITTDQVRLFKRALYRDMSGSTVNRYLATLSGVFRRYRGRVVNPAAGVGRYEERSDAWSAISRPEVERIVEHLRGTGPEYLAPLVLLLFELAARFSEIHGLRWENVDLDWQDRRGVRRGLILWPRTKSGEAQSVALTLRARGELVARRRGPAGRSAWCFPSRTGADAPVHPSNVRRAWKRALVALELPTGLRLHDLRHGRATQMIEAGVAPHKVQRVGRWRDRASMDRYIHMDVDHAAEALDEVDALPDEAGVERMPVPKTVPNGTTR